MRLTQEEITAILVAERDAPPTTEDRVVADAIQDNTEMGQFLAEALTYPNRAASILGAVMLGYKIGLADSRKQKNEDEAALQRKSA